ncbi:hypothetical protein LTR56_011134 [Elasticomyces elasticus]|nr:hypothetical protein LTR56_011134 [Elasticomyces elasticus]KAK3662446.1 hypothetical protein LTR22_006725 [Elasticomyces elasticus]KAK4926435.1 hypothetical protein LTR49_006642 [Elasticomyces elasticus]KAK5761192.1 hypothetical protein LTS12_008673 [Elasticomyces elasticus]
MAPFVRTKATQQIQDKVAAMATKLTPSQELLRDHQRALAEMWALADQSSGNTTKELKDVLGYSRGVPQAINVHGLQQASSDVNSVLTNARHTAYGPH